jgi:hypothetical protein
MKTTILLLTFFTLAGSLPVWTADHCGCDSAFSSLEGQPNDWPPLDLATQLGPVLLPCEDRKSFLVLQEYYFVDAEGVKWSAPRSSRSNGFCYDGASIPRILHTLFGAPLGDRYRNAAVIHDWYCQAEIGSSTAVHKMFYEACLASGLAPAKAKLAYAAVVIGGPYWGEEEHLSKFWKRFSRATEFPLFGRSNSFPTNRRKDSFRLVEVELTQKELAAIADWIEQEDPDLRQIHQIALNRTFSDEVHVQNLLPAHVNPRVEDNFLMYDQERQNLRNSVLQDASR